METTTFSPESLNKTEGVPKLIAIIRKVLLIYGVIALGLGALSIILSFPFLLMAIGTSKPYELLILLAPFLYSLPYFIILPFLKKEISSFG